MILLFKCLLKHYIHVYTYFLFRLSLLLASSMAEMQLDQASACLSFDSKGQTLKVDVSTNSIRTVSNFAFPRPLTLLEARSSIVKRARTSFAAKFFLELDNFLIFKISSGERYSGVGRGSTDKLVGWCCGRSEGLVRGRSSVGLSRRDPLDSSW